MSIQKIHEGKKLFYSFAIYKLSGTVLSENTRSETEVSGKIYGGGTNSTYGTTAPVQGKIESKTTRYQTIYLREDNGAEHAIELVDLVVGCREGHKLTLWRLGDNLWFQVENHTTNQTFRYNGFKKMMYPKVIYFVIGIIFGIYYVDQSHTGGKYFLALIFSILFGLALATIPCGIIAWLREKAVFEAAT
ncbi:MAG: hypothetical protein R3D86_14230 [Emcibacteraceae bacterium]